MKLQEKILKAIRLAQTPQDVDIIYRNVDAEDVKRFEQLLKTLAPGAEVHTVRSDQDGKMYWVRSTKADIGRVSDFR